MRCRFFVAIAAVTLTAAAFAQTPKAPLKPKTGTVPRTPDGHPDLQGVWTNATLTQLERPAAFADKATLSAAEAADYEKKDIQSAKAEDGASDGPIIAAAGSSGTGGYNFLFLDRGSELESVDGQKRTSLIVDPADGKVPPITPEGRKRIAEMMMGYGRFNTVKDRPMSERCLIGFGSTSGPPMLPVLYNNNYQLVQTPGYVMILVEMVHDVRIIRMNAQHEPPNVRLWLGDSVGHWEGDTLVVDITNFTDKTTFRGSSENLHVIERFTRAGPSDILYKATIDDPSTFSKVWTVEFPFVAAPGPIYEYACHEGNYAMTDILGGARKAEGTPKK